MAKVFQDDEEQTPSVWGEDGYAPDAQGAASDPVGGAPPSGPSAPQVFSNGESDPSAQAPASPAQGAVPQVFSPLEQNEHAAQAKLAKLQYQDANPWGTVDNHPGTLGKIAHGFSVAGQIAGNVFAPHILANVPGTEAYRNVHEQQLGQEVNDIEKEKVSNAKEQAETESERAKPGIAEAKNETAEDKVQSEEQGRQDKTDAALAQHGYMRADDGTIQPLPYERMSESQQAVHDLKGSQAALADATSQYRAAQATNIPEQMALAKQKLDSIHRTQDVALQRLGLSRDQFNLRATGTLPGGQIANGAMIDDNGKGVGTAFQQNVRPTGQERNKADMAASAATQISDMKEIVQKHPTLFGPGYGRSTEFQQWLGSGDPDAQRFQAARTIAADHLAGTFGGRSEYALKALDDALGQFKTNPQAGLAGLDQLAGANKLFKEKGTVHTKGSANDTSGGGGNKITVTDPGGTTHTFSSQQAADRFKALAGIK